MNASRDDAPLAHLVVVDLSTTTAGATATQFLADAGAEVLFIEAAGGSPLRTRADWPALARGKRSIELDIHDADGRRTLDALLERADVLVTTFSPRAAERLELAAEHLDAALPHLVSAAITGWGPTGPLRDLPGYPGLVMAKLGYLHEKSMLALRPGPAYSSVPFAVWGAAHTAVHGILSAVLERATSGRGQHVDADLVRGLGTIDTWQWTSDLIGIRWPDAFTPIAAFTPQGEVLGHLIYPLLIAPTSDGTFIQFAQTQPRLFQAMMEEFDLSHLWTDPKWAGLPILPTQELRTELWELMISKVNERTLAEWEATFRSNANISAETFRHGPGVFDHPQLVHEGRVAVVDDPDLGPVRQPSTLVHVDGQPLTELRPAPRLDDYRQALAECLTRPPVAHAPTRPAPGLPLAGITIIDLGVMFAGPHGATLLTDLGARVVKVEALGGDTIRNILQFPEAGGAKVMSGKETLCVDLAAPAGREILHKLVAGADVVLQSFRAGAAARIEMDSTTLRAIKPDLVYVNAPGYGIDGPYGTRPAYAPSIAAAGGLALAEAPDAVDLVGDIEEVKRAAARLNCASAIPVMQADGISALGVASTILLGLVARSLGRPTGDLTVTMLGTTSNALVEWAIDYDGRPDPVVVDEQSWGLGPLYRIYPAGTGYVFLACPTEPDWQRFTAAADPGLATDARFGDSVARAANADALTARLGALFATRPALDWEADLAPLRVGVVAVHEGSPTRQLQTDPELAAVYAAETTSAVFDQHLRPAPTVTFSRSTTQALGFSYPGAHTDRILAELGYDADEITRLHKDQIVE